MPTAWHNLDSNAFHCTSMNFDTNNIWMYAIWNKLGNRECSKNQQANSHMHCVPHVFKQLNFSFKTKHCCWLPMRYFIYDAHFCFKYFSFIFIVCFFLSIKFHFEMRRSYLFIIQRNLICCPNIWKRWITHVSWNEYDKLSFVVTFGTSFSQNSIATQIRLNSTIHGSPKCCRDISIDVWLMANRKYANSSSLAHSETNMLMCCNKNRIPFKH